MEKQNKNVGSGKKTVKSRGAGSKSQRGKNVDSGSGGNELFGDAYRPSFPNPNYFSQPPPNFFSQPATNYSPPFPPQYFTHQMPMVPPNRLDFSQDAMANFDAFGSYRNPHQSQRSPQNEQPLPIYDDDDEEDDPVPETQFTEENEEDEVEIRDDPKGKKKSKMPNRAEREVWTPPQEIALAKAFVHCSVDRKKGNERTRKSLWTDVLKHYNQQLGGSGRTNHQVHSKWTKMQTQLNAFNGLYIQAERLQKSGCTTLDVMTRALEDFRERKGSAFKHLDAWKIVKESEKWTKVPLMDEISGSSSDKRRRTSETGSFYPTGNDECGAPSGASVPDLNEDSRPTQPKRRQRKNKETMSSGQGELGGTFSDYAKTKEAVLVEMTERKKKCQDEYLTLLAAQTDSVKKISFNTDFEFFNKPHDNLSRPMRKVAIARKREIAQAYDWPMDGLESESD